MKVKEYLEHMHDAQQVMFIKARARKDAHTPFYHAEYQTTPVYYTRAWMASKLTDSVILNDRQMPIEWLSGAKYSAAVMSGNIKCLLVASEEDFALLIPDEVQRAEMVQYIDEQLEP